MIHQHTYSSKASHQITGHLHSENLSVEFHRFPTVRHLEYKMECSLARHDIVCQRKSNNKRSMNIDTLLACKLQKYMQISGYDKWKHHTTCINVASYKF